MTRRRQGRLSLNVEQCYDKQHSMNKGLTDNLWDFIWDNPLIRSSLVDAKSHVKTHSFVQRWFYPLLEESCSHKSRADYFKTDSALWREVAMEDDPWCLFRDETDALDDKLECVLMDLDTVLDSLDKFDAEPDKQEKEEHTFSLYSSSSVVGSEYEARHKVYYNAFHTGMGIFTHSVSTDLLNAKDAL